MNIRTHEFWINTYKKLMKVKWWKWGEHGKKLWVLGLGKKMQMLVEHASIFAAMEGHRY